MKKIWPYLTTFLAGVAGGFVMMWYMVRNRISHVTIGKIKQKGGPGNVMDTDTIINMKPINTLKTKRELRKTKRQERKLKKVVNKNLKT